MVLKKEITLQIKELLQKNPQGLSITDIVKEININRNTAGRYLENLLVSGQVDMRRLGMAKIYMISQRVPVSAVLSISSELVFQLDSNLRIVFANEPFIKLVGSESKNLLGKNIEYTPVQLVFEKFFAGFLENIRTGIGGKEWSGEIALTSKDIILFCQIAPTVFDDGRKGVSVIFQNITEKKRAELKLEESERQFRLLAENSLDMIGRIKPDYTHTYASPAYTTTLGYLPEEIVGKPARLFIHPDDIHIMETARRKLNPENPSATVRFRSRHRDGHYLWIESHVRGIFDEKQLSEYYTVTRDISERKKAEEELQESEMRYRSLVETTGTGYVIIDKDGRVITANQEYVRLTGRRSLAEIEGRPLIDWTATYDRERNAREIEQCFRKGQVKDLEIDYQRPDGTIQPIEINASVIQSGSGGIILTLCRDITQRRQDEKTLQESEDRYRKLVEISPEAVFLHQEGKIIYANPATFTLLGAERPDEIIGKNVLDFVSQEFRDVVRANIKKDLQGKVSPRTELHMVRIDGKPIIIEGRGIATETDGKPAVQVAIRDITEQKRAELALRESEATARALLNAPTDSVLLIDDQGIILAHNRIAASRLGKHGDDLIGTSSYDHLPNEVAQRRRLLMAPLLEKKESVRFVDERDGRWYDTVSYPVLNETGDVKKIAIIARDITEQKSIEKLLRESEQMYRHLLEQSFDAIAIHKEGKIAFLNEKAAKILGAESAVELIGRSIFDIIHPDSLKDLENRLQILSSAKGKPVPVLTEKFFRLDRTTVTVEVMAIGFEDNDKPAVRVAFREMPPVAER